MTKTHLMYWSLLLVPSLLSAQQLLVYPAVTDEQPGKNGSLWVTTSIVVKLDPQDDVTVRRKWVCLPGGGFADDPSTAPTWSLAEWSAGDRFWYALGGELFEGVEASVGAVGMEVEGGEVLAHANVVDVNWGFYSQAYKVAFGQGQHITALEAPLVGPSHIPWLGGCRGLSCEHDPDEDWQYLRNNIGIINPNPEPLTITGTVLPFGYLDTSTGSVWQEWAGGDPETFHKVIPPYGWNQFHWWSLRWYAGLDGGFYPWAGFVISLTPNSALPYYAYASVVFSPDPDPNVTVFNDPMFIPAEPGYVPPVFEGSSKEMVVDPSQQVRASSTRRR